MDAAAKFNEKTKNPDLNGANSDNEDTQNTINQKSVREKVRSYTDSFMVNGDLKITENAYMVISVKIE